MYPQFIDGTSMRGVPEPSRSPARHPFMNYYGSKLPDGMQYGNMAPAPHRLPNPYTGKPDMMYGGHPNWNPMMIHQPYGVAKPPQMNKPTDYQFHGQEHMYGRMYPHPPPHDPYNPGFVPPGQQFPPHYPGGPTPHHYPGDGGIPYMDSFPPPGTGTGPPAPAPAPAPAHQNDHWSRQQVNQQPFPQQQQPAVLINDGGGASDSGSPAPRTSIGWGPVGDMLTPDPNKPLHPSVSPRNSPGLRKEPSVSSLKEALMSGSQLYNEGKSNSATAHTPGGVATPSNLGPSPGAVGGVNYPGNSSPFLGVSEMKERASPMATGLPSGSAQTPHLSSPVGIIGVGGTNEEGGSPMIPPSQPTPPSESHMKNSFDGGSGLSSTATGINRQPSPFEMDKLLGLKENEPTNGKTASPVTTETVNSPGSSVGGGAGSPGSRKVRMSPTVLSPVDRNHTTFSAQYKLSKEPGRKEFLDALLDYLLKEGISLLKVPTVCKTQLDLYKSFTSVQQLGGFRHVVEKRLWKDVLRSFSPYISAITQPALRLLQEYYVKMLLPYECHISNTSLKECQMLYETKGIPAVNNIHEGGGASDVSNSTTAGNTGGEHPTQPREGDMLIPFNEDSQNSLDGISNQPLPDISVQEAEFVLGIPPNSNQALPSPHTYPPNANWSDFIPNQPTVSPDERAYPSPHHAHVPAHPGMGGDPSFMFPPYNDQFADYRNRMQMGHYMNRQPYVGGPMHAPAHMDPSGYAPPHYPPTGRPPPPDMGHYNNMDWQWSQPRPRLPPPLPPHLQSVAFQIPHSSSSPVPQNSSRPSTPQSVPPERASPRPSATPSGNNQPNLDPIKIHWQDQQHSHLHGNGNVAAHPKNVSGIVTPPTSQPLPKVPKEMSHDKDDVSGRSILPPNKVVEDMKMPATSISTSRPSLPAPPPTPVEMTEPLYRKRRKLNSDHCGQIEPWRVMMSLKSGLAPDSTWALDTLSILLHDDRTVGFFYLKHHHSLLNTLVDHFTVCLHEIFGEMFPILSKYTNQPNEPEPKGTATPLNEPTPLESSVYHMTKSDVQMGRTDLLSHIHSFYKRESEDDVEKPQDPLHESDRIDEKSQDPLLKSKRGSGAGKTSRVDETPLNDLLKRDALGERILFHLKTPRRGMVCSPIQKFFPPNEESPGGSPIQEEIEILKREPTPLFVLPEDKDSLIRRCLSISNIIRSLSFIPGNDVEFSQHSAILVILGKLLLCNHSHLPKPSSPSSSLLNRQGHTPLSTTEDKPTPQLMSVHEENEINWSWDCLEVLRENVFVILANIAGQLDLSIYPEAINYPILDGLLHWLVCPSSTASDPLPDSASTSTLSPQRLVLEALAKISISEINISYILATPTLARLDLVYDILLNFISQRKQPASKQFALVFLSNLAQGGEGPSRMIGQQKLAIPLLLECIETAEHSHYQQQSKIYSYSTPDDPSSLSIAMLRRAAITLHCLARVHLNRVSFLPYCSRLLYLVMSGSLESSLTSILSDVLFELNRIV